MAVNLTNAEAALKSYYIDAVSEQLNNKVNPLLAEIKKTTEDVWGKDVKKTVTIGLNGGVGAGDEEGDLPSASGNNYVQLTSNLKNLYGRIEISDKALRASENNSGALVSLLNAEMEGLIKSSSYNFGRMLFGNGSGVVAKIEAVNENKIYIRGEIGVAPGMKVEVVDENGNVQTKFGKLTVLAVDHNIAVIDVDKYDLVQEDFTDMNFSLAIQGSANKEITGFQKIFSETGELYGLNKEQNSFLVPKIITASSNFNLSTIQKTIDELEMSTGNTPNFIVCSLGVRRTMQELLSQNNRNIETMELAGGYKSMSYNGIPIVGDRFCPSGTMYLINTNDFALHQLCDWQWLSDDDGRVLKQIPGKPVYTATLVKYAELMCSNPSGQACIKSIVEK